MDAFHNMLSADLDCVFLNPLEFGEAHTWDGIPITAILDADLSKTPQPMADGVYAWEGVLHLKASDIGEMPMPGSLHELDGRDYMAGTVTRARGIYAISLGAIV